MSDNPFTHSRRALHHYDHIDAPHVEQLFTDLLNKPVVNEQLNAWITAEKEAMDKVRHAFYQDTRTFNSLDNCLRVDLDFIRRCVDNAPNPPNEETLP